MKNGSEVRRRASSALGATRFAVTDHVRIQRDVLLADQDRVVPGCLQGVNQVLRVIVEGPATMSQAGHAVVVAVLAGQQGGATARTGGGGTEGPTESDPLVGQQLDVRRQDLMAVGLNVAARVMRMHVDDVGAVRHHRSLRTLSLAL
jgi:hypothetical protein